ncbi:MAG: hypothetical protein MRJ68_15345 [Nitrospira sp.]|nr:hypothetical protein [Nitrospira sp.]
MRDPERRLTHPENPVVAIADSDEPATRHASMHVNGLSLVDTIESQGTNVGKNGWYKTDKDGRYVTDSAGKRIKTDGKCSADSTDFGKNLCALAAPGETRTYTWYAKKEGTFFLYSMGAPAGGEGDGGQLGLGLFGAINVQPNGANWYRSQVTEQELKYATKGKRNTTSRSSTTRQRSTMVRWPVSQFSICSSVEIKSSLTARAIERPVPRAVN